MSPSDNTRSGSTSSKETLAIVPDSSFTSTSLPKSDFENLHSKIQTMNDNILDVNNKHQSDMKTMNDNITTMLQNLTAANSKTANHEEQFTEISYKLSDYEDRLDKMSIKDTQIHPLSIHITKITDKSSKTDKHED